MKTTIIYRSVISLLATVAAPIVFAHPEHGSADVLSGFAHTLMGFDHVLMMLAIGLYASHVGGHARYMMPQSFVLSLMAGSFLAIQGFVVPYVEQGIMLSMIVIGLGLATLTRLSRNTSIALISGFAVYHGAAHGVEMPIHIDPILYILGFSLASALLHMGGILVNQRALSLGKNLYQELPRKVVGVLMLFTGVITAIN